MKYKSITIPFIVIMFILTSCRSSDESDAEIKTRMEKESAAVRQVIKAHNANLNHWYNTGQVDSVLTVFNKNARQMVPNMPALVGHKEIRAFWSSMMKSGDLKIEIKAESVIAYGPLAVERGKYTLIFNPFPNAPAGIVSIADTGKYLVHWQKTNGEWFIVHDIPNSDLPLPTPSGNN